MNKPNVITHISNYILTTENIEIIIGIKYNNKYYDGTVFKCLDCGTTWNVRNCADILICRFKSKSYAEYHGREQCKNEQRIF